MYAPTSYIMRMYMVQPLLLQNPLSTPPTTVHQPRNAQSLSACIINITQPKSRCRSCMDAIIMNSFLLRQRRVGRGRGTRTNGPHRRAVAPHAKAPDTFNLSKQLRRACDWGRHCVRVGSTRCSIVVFVVKIVWAHIYFLRVCGVVERYCCPPPNILHSFRREPGRMCSVSC